MKLMNGDCFEKLKELEDNSIDSIVTDPPYGLALMGKEWDYEVPRVGIWQECLRVLKPGGQLLAFAGSRTQHRMAVNIEDAGFEIRDLIFWCHASGMPKGSNIGKSTKKIIETNEFDGIHSSLKPASEPITLARKPISEPTIAENVIKYKTGGLNIDKCRIPTEEKIENHSRSKESSISKGIYSNSKEQETHQTSGQKLGRFPTNVIHDGSEEITSGFPYSVSGSMKVGAQRSGYKKSLIVGDAGFVEGDYTSEGRTSSEGSAARFFYCAKATSEDRNEGILNGKNIHITVKPHELMKYLVKLVTPKGGIVLDPFMGSGSTGKAAVAEDYEFVGIELDEIYFEIAKQRIKYFEKDYIQNELF